MKTKINIAIFASGTGSNAQKIISHFEHNELIHIALIVSNKADAGVLNIANAAKIPSIVIERNQFMKGDGYVNTLQKHDIEWIILAGFLWKVPETLISAFPQKIINIHPALLPKYGGKGMYGHFVHEAVVANKEKESGITIHFIDEHYDHGAHIFQAKCEIQEQDTAEIVAKKVLALEHQYFPTIIEKTILSKN
ncbi:MAG: phosphoribosylglycinamide formyltransferase [Chitinophagaceae bacterium]|nr:MAG: phosphoribosylglycinamide formyltransferase [Chitinophagaceae bacterium]